MTETAASILMVGSELAVLLLLVLGMIIYVFLSRHKKDKNRAMDLVSRLKKKEPERRENIKLLLIETYGYGEEEALEKAVELVQVENHLYTKILRMYMGRDRDAITGLDKDVFGLLEIYRELIDTEMGGDEDSEKPSSPVILRQENRQLREAKRQVEADLAAAVEAMENMMSEYASMYEGGQKDGEQRVKNEMFQLREKLSKRVEPEESSEFDELEEIDDFDIEQKPK